MLFTVSISLNKLYIFSHTQSKVKIVSIFITIIINKGLFISFIFSKPKDFLVEVENYKLDYLNNDLRNKDLIFINKTSFWPNNLAHLVDSFVLLN